MSRIRLHLQAIRPEAAREALTLQKNEAVALGIADRYTFETPAEAAGFREKKLSEIVNAGKELKRN